MPACIAVVDDEAGVRRSVERILRRRGYRVLAFATAADFIAAPEANSIACVLADIRMPGMTGLEMQRALHVRGDEVPVVFMTGYSDMGTIVEAMREGASDVLAKPFDPDTLYRAIEAAIARGRSSTAELRSLGTLWASLARLTPREAEIAALVSQGLLNKQVGAATGISEKTVKVHRARAMRKLGAPSVAELVRIVDQVMAHRDRTRVRVDDDYVVRPRAAGIIVRTVQRRGRPGDVSAPSRPDDPVEGLQP